MSNKIAAGIERVSAVFRAVLWEDAKRHSLSPLQMQILLFISSHAPSLNTISQLAKEFAVTKATMSDAVRVLLEKNLLKKQQGDDRRGFTLMLVENASKQMSQIPSFPSFLDDVLAKAPAEDMQKMWEGVLLTVTYLQKGGLVPLRMCFNCNHFGRNHVSGAPHYCKLMQQPLTLTDIRLDCPEHDVLAA